MKFRFLPIIMALCLFLLADRTISIWQHLHPSFAFAEETTETATDTTPTEQQETSVLPETIEITNPETIDSSKDIVEFSPSELSLLQSLRQRREDLLHREQSLEQREKLLQGMETRLQGKIEELNQLKAEMERIRADIDNRAEKFRQAENEQIEMLVRVYERMRPKDAAAILNNLELTILLDVVKGMREAKLAPIMAQMDPLKANIVTSELAQREELPIP